jgi:hypothetical protein
MNNQLGIKTENKPLTNKIKETSNKTIQFAKNSINAAKEVGVKTKNAVASEVQKTSNAVKSTLNSSQTFQSAKRGSFALGSFAKDFAEKNSTVSKFIFILFIIILFGLLIRVGVYIISLFTLPNKNPIVVNGMLPTNSLTKYQVNPTMANSKPILRSVNENQGMEFTWSTWIFIDNVSTSDDSTKDNPKRIFSKGGKSETGDTFAMNSPGLYLFDPSSTTSTSNAITIVTTVFNDVDNGSSGSGVTKKITIRNIPIQKWVNVIIRAQNKSIDVYINGVLSTRNNMEQVIKQNYGDIFVGDDVDGMNGFISSLRYFDHAIGNMKIQEINQQGPNLKMIGNKNKETMPPYLATRWYLDNINENITIT